MRKRYRLKLYSLIAFLFLIPNFIFAQSVSVKGTVVDEKGEALISVSVRVKRANSLLGTITDVNGNFTLKADAKDSLTFTYVGFEPQTKAVDNSTNLRITMTPSLKGLGEVVIVGYGQQKKIAVTSAISSVSGEELVKIHSPSLGNALAGKLPGITTVQYSGLPGGDDPNIFVRGLGSLSTNGSRPLILVDGVERSFTQIDPNEVSDISILKDASATAVFGVRGANGVILITTKRGEVGKAQISASASTGLQVPTMYLKYVDSYNYANIYNNMQQGDGVLPANYRFSTSAIQHFKDKDMPLLYPDMNWVDYVMKPVAIQSQQNVNVSGGNEQAKYFVSVGSLQQDGLFRTFSSDPNENFTYKRYNYRANLDINIDKINSLAINIGGRLEQRGGLPRGEQDIFSAITTSSPMSGAGIVNGNRIVGNPVYIGSGPTADGDPMRFYGSGHQKSGTNVLNLDLIYVMHMDFLTKGLNFKLKGSYNSTSDLTKVWSNYQTYPTYKPYLLPDNKTVVFETSGDKWKPTYSESTSFSRNWYAEGSFDYSRTFGKHNVTGLLLYNQSKYYYPSQYSDIPHGYVGVVGRATYSYAYRYLLDLNVGYNGSENFAPGKRFGTFPSASVGWIATEEPWMKSQKAISYLKFRYSYGIVGNDNIGGYRFIYAPPAYSVRNGYYNTYGGGQHGYNFGTTNTTFVKGVTEDTSGNPFVTWETSLKQNLGMDLRAFRDRLSFNIDLFYEERKDILVSNAPLLSVPSALVSTGVNYGAVTNKGFEITMNWKDKINGFGYSLSPSLSFSRNKITQLAEDPQDYEYLYRVGHSVNQPFGYDFFSFYQKGITETAYQTKYGKPMPAQLGQANLKDGDCIYSDLNGDGKITNQDVHAIGFSDNPELTFALNGSMSFKNFDLTMLWVGATNVNRSLSWPYNPQFGQFHNQSLVQWVADNSWTPETASTAKLPRLTIVNEVNNSPTSSVWLVDGSYVRLRNLEIGYTIKKIPALGISNLRIYLNGSNLLTLSAFKGNDPENVGGGYQNTVRYPLTKIYNVGFKVNF
jgi:TonB-linked SusC/RagA family outer membrane protein